MNTIVKKLKPLKVVLEEGEYIRFGKRYQNKKTFCIQPEMFKNFGKTHEFTVSTVENTYRLDGYSYLKEMFEPDDFLSEEDMEL